MHVQETKSTLKEKAHKVLSVTNAAKKSFDFDKLESQRSYFGK